MATMSGRALRQKVQDAVSATGNGTALTVLDPQTGSYVAGAFQLSGTFTATITFECTVDGTNWVAMECASSADEATVSTTATAAGVWKFTCLGYYQVRARVTWSSGTSVTVWGSLVA